MSQNDNDPRTSFQAGEPIQPSEALPADRTRAAGSISKGAATPLDRVMAALKVYERWGLAVGVGVQLLVLFVMMAMGVLKWLGGGNLR